MLLAAEKVAEKTSRLAGGNGQYPESQIDNIDRAPMVKPPAPAHRGRQGHLSGCRDQELLDRFHTIQDTWYRTWSHQASVTLASVGAVTGR